MNTPLCLQKFPRALPTGTPSGEGVTLHPLSRHNRDKISFALNAQTTYRMPGKDFLAWGGPCTTGPLVHWSLALLIYWYFPFPPGLFATGSNLYTGLAKTLNGHLVLKGQGLHLNLREATQTQIQKLPFGSRWQLLIPQPRKANLCPLVGA